MFPNIDSNVRDHLITAQVLPAKVYIVLSGDFIYTTDLLYSCMYRWARKDFLGNSFRKVSKGWEKELNLGVFIYLFI